MFPDRYYVHARIFPALICSLPILLFYHFHFSKYISQIVVSYFFTQIVTGVTIFSALTYLFTEVVRILGKRLEAQYFQNGLSFHTVSYLMPQNKNMSRAMKDKIFNKYSDEFQFEISVEQLEALSEDDSRGKISEMCGLIRAKLKPSKILLQSNYEYGFIRNLLGSSSLSLIISLLGILFFSFYIFNQTAMICFLFLVVLFLVLYIFRFKLLERLGSDYAKRFFQEYMNT